MEKTETRTLLIKQSNEAEIQIDIPADWKITFGPLFTSSEKFHSRTPAALRIYETDKTQRAIFTDVIWFRDMSIPIRIKRKDVWEKQEYTERGGERKRTSQSKATAKWVDPDKEVE